MVGDCRPESRDAPIQQGRPAAQLFPGTSSRPAHLHDPSRISPDMISSGRINHQTTLQLHLATRHRTGFGARSGVQPSTSLAQPSVLSFFNTGSLGAVLCVSEPLEGQYRGQRQSSNSKTPGTDLKKENSAIRFPPLPAPEGPWCCRGAARVPASRLESGAGPHELCWTAALAPGKHASKGPVRMISESF